MKDISKTDLIYFVNIGGIVDHLYLSFLFIWGKKPNLKDISKTDLIYKNICNKKGDINIKKGCKTKKNAIFTSLPCYTCDMELTQTNPAMLNMWHGTYINQITCISNIVYIYILCFTVQTYFLFLISNLKPNISIDNIILEKC